MYIEQIVRVVRFLLVETGTYNDQFRRPYETHADKRELNILSDRFAGAHSLGPALLGGVANQFIQPSMQWESQIGIANGWDTKRFQFMMEVEYSSYAGPGGGEMILGYTDHPGVSHSGFLDEQMVFTINSVAQVKKVRYNQPGVGVVDRWQQYDSAHVINNKDFSSVNSMSQVYQMRPEDVYKNLTKNSLPGEGTMLDSRVALTPKASLSKRTNNIATHYAARIFEGYNQASRQSEDSHMKSFQGLYQAAEDLVLDPYSLEDVFLEKVMQVRGDPIPGKVFTMRDLKDIDPSLESRSDDVIRVLRIANPHEVHHRGDTHPWGDKENETLAASVLMQTVPSMLMELGLTALTFYTENTSRPNGQVVTEVAGWESFSNGDVRNNIMEFMTSFETTVFRGLTNNGSISMEIHMDADVLGETRIFIRYDGGPEIPFVAPSFADALMAPIVTNDHERTQAVANDFGKLFDAVRVSAPVIDNSFTNRPTMSNRQSNGWV